MNLTPTVTIVNGEKVMTPNAPVYVYDTSGPFRDSAASSSADLSYIGVAVKYAYHLSKRTDLYVGADFSQAKASSIKFEGADEGSLKYRTTSVYSGMTHYF